VVENINAPLFPIDRSSRQKIGTLKLNDTIDQMDLTDIYRVLHPSTAQYTFFSAMPETLSKIDHILGRKTSLHKYKNTEMNPCTSSDHNTIKQKIKNKRNSRKYANNWRLNNTFCSMISGSWKK
jgi:exonuclease III